MKEANFDVPPVIWPTASVTCPIWLEKIIAGRAPIEYIVDMSLSWRIKLVMPMRWPAVASVTLPWATVSRPAVCALLRMKSTPVCR
jgi:hypothetical protein